MGLNLNAVLNKPLALVGIAIGAIMVFLTLAALVPDLFAAGKATTENVTAADTGSTIGDTMASALGPFIPIGLVVGVIGIAFGAFVFGKGR